MFASKNELFTTPSGGYTIGKSVRLRSSASAYLNRTQISGNSQIFTWSGWIKRGKLGSAQDIFGTIVYPTPSNQQSYFSFNSDDTFHIDLYSGSSYFGQLYTTQVFRDPSSWYHIVVAFDTTQATASNRIKLYVNGTQVTAFGTASYPSQNANTYINNTANSQVGIGRVAPYNSSQYFDGYLTEINFIDGQALTPSSFGTTNATTGVWQPAKYTGTYGTNGFYLNFSDNSSNTATTIGKDYSGNGNNWTPNNISVTAGATYDSMVDSPTTDKNSSNYAVLNPTNLGGTSITLSNGNLFATFAGASWFTTSSTIGMNGSGKYYFEFTKTDTTSQQVGIFPSTASISSFVGNDANGYGYFSANGYLYNNSGSSITFGATFTTGDVIGVAFDASTGKLWFSKNNTWQASGDPSAGTSPAATASTAYTYVAALSTNGSGVGTINFGQRPFSYTPPTGFVALNTYNLPASTITNGAAYMAATTWTSVGGTETISNTVNGVGFQPDFVWMKNRTISQNNYLVDSNRGSSKILVSNTTSAEVTDATFLTSFNSNGFSLGSGGFSASQAIVGWQWKAGGTSSSNTNGSITSTVSVGATQGFSVVTYTGNGSTGTVGHGLGVAPSMIIVKNRTSSVDNWQVYHTILGNTQRVTLNTTNAADSPSPSMWNSTSPTSTVFSVGNQSGVNYATTYVAYCFAAVAGYSAFGSYTGNGSTDGVFVYTGFQPRWIMVKQSSAAGEDWLIQDTSRKPYNTSTTGTSLAADTSGAEVNSSAQLWDVLSNGFKLRASGGGVNASGATYIYMAFASNPFSKSLAF